MIRMIGSLATAMALAACCMLSLPAMAFDGVAVDGVEQMESVDHGAIAPVPDEAAPTSRTGEPVAAIAADADLESGQRIVTVEHWQMPQKSSQADATASDHATAHLQPCLARRARFVLPGPVEHRPQRQGDEHMTRHKADRDRHFWSAERHKV